MKLRVNDKIQVIAGKDKGKTSKITRVIPKKNKVIVEGLNTYKRHVKKQQNNPGGIIEVERPIDISKVQIIGSDGKTPTRIGIQRSKTGDKIRIDKKTGKALDKKLSS